MHFGYSRTALRSELHSQAPPSVDHTLSPTSSVSSLFSSSARRGSEARATTANERAEWGSRKPKGSTAKLSGPVVCLVPCSLPAVLSMFSGSITPRQGIA
ncbi:hypothetical protein IG631_17549 [Alternaria alternata]|nr:hypothetical protein IG631_17549 [Alternaria alternata]